VALSNPGGGLASMGLRSRNHLLVEHGNLAGVEAHLPSPDLASMQGPFGFCCSLCEEGYSEGPLALR